MISLDDFVIEAECPRCGFYNPFQIKDIAMETPVICRGCKTTIHPRDHLGEIQQARKEINKAFENLDEVIKNLGR